MIDNRTDFPGKIARAVQALRRILPMPTPREVEVKYRLLNFVPGGMLVSHAVVTEIVQTYLKVPEGSLGLERRVRSATTNGEEQYTYTEKLPTGESGTREERECAIGSIQYAELLQERDPTLDQIVKRRHRFIYESRTIELDVYEGRNHGLVIVEVELQDISERAELKFPASWELVDVTDDPAYKNRALAEKVSA